MCGAVVVVDYRLNARGPDVGRRHSVQVPNKAFLAKRQERNDSQEKPVLQSARWSWRSYIEQLRQQWQQSKQSFKSRLVASLPCLMRCELSGVSRLFLLVPPPPNACSARGRRTQRCRGRPGHYAVVVPTPDATALRFCASFLARARRGSLLAMSAGTRHVKRCAAEEGTA